MECAIKSSKKVGVEAIQERRVVIVIDVVILVVPLVRLLVLAVGGWLVGWS